MDLQFLLAQAELGASTAHESMLIRTCRRNVHWRRLEMLCRWLKESIGDTDILVCPMKFFGGGSIIPLLTGFGRLVVLPLTHDTVPWLKLSVVHVHSSAFL